MAKMMSRAPAAYADTRNAGAPPHVQPWPSFFDYHGWTSRGPARTFSPGLRFPATRA